MLSQDSAEAGHPGGRPLAGAGALRRGRGWADCSAERRALSLAGCSERAAEPASFTTKAGAKKTATAAITAIATTVTIARMIIAATTTAACTTLATIATAGSTTLATIATRALGATAFVADLRSDKAAARC